MLFDIEEGVTAAGGPLLRVRGELDSEGAPQLAAAVDRSLATDPAVLVLDLTATTYLDSRGARELAASARRAAGRGTALTVVCPRENRRVWRVFDLLGLPSAIDVVTDRAHLDPGSRP